MKRFTSMIDDSYVVEYPDVCECEGDEYCGAAIDFLGEIENILGDDIDLEKLKYIVDMYRGIKENEKRWEELARKLNKQVIEYYERKVIELE